MYFNVRLANHLVTQQHLRPIQCAFLSCPCQSLCCSYICCCRYGAWRHGAPILCYLLGIWEALRTMSADLREFSLDCCYGVGQLRQVAAFELLSKANRDGNRKGHSKGAKGARARDGRKTLRIYSRVAW